MNNKLYTSGEFARLCSTTKDTLLVYDRKGILKPEIIGENGYRYYLGDQYTVFYTIKSLQTAGASLSEISEILNSGNTENFIRLLETNKAALAERQLELIHMQNYIDKILSTVPYMYSNDNDLHLKYFPEEYLIIASTNYKTPPKEGYYYSWESVKKLDNYMRAKGYCQFGAIEKFDMLTYENFKKEEFYPSYYCSKISFKPNDEALYVKPSGTYATMKFFGSWENLPENYKIFKAALEKRELKYVGNCFMVDILSSLLLGGKEEHGYILSIKIEQ